MLRAGVIYTGRVGDLVGTLPRSRALATEGFEVWHYCCAQYADLFRAVSYVKPRIVEGNVVDAYPLAVQLATAECDYVCNRQLYPPGLYWEFRKSNLSWREFYYQDRPELAKEMPVFDVDTGEGLAASQDTCVMALHAYSRPLRLDRHWLSAVIAVIAKRGLRPLYTCAEGEKAPFDSLPVDHTPLGGLPSLLRRARMLFTLNSGIAWIATGVGIPTLLIAQESVGVTDSPYPAPCFVPVSMGCSVEDIEKAVSQVLEMPRP